MNNPHIKQIRRSANWGLYGSIGIVLAAVVFHFCPYEIRQTNEVQRWMLIAGTVMAVLTVVMLLLTIRKTPPQLRQLSTTEQKLKGYASYVANIYRGTWLVVAIECALIVLMADTSLLMVIILMVLVLFVSYPNMYKMKHDLSLDEATMRQLFGDAYIADPQPADAQPDLELADAQLARDNEPKADDTQHTSEA